jgi:hypothetical protein
MRKKGLRDSVATEAVLREGWLQKQSSGTFKQWQKRYFRLSGHYLTYYADEKTDEVKGACDLNTVTLCVHEELSLRVTAPGGELLLRAASAEDAEKWQTSLLSVGPHFDAFFAEVSSADAGQPPPSSAAALAHKVASVGPRGNLEAARPRVASDGHSIFRAAVAAGGRGNISINVASPEGSFAVDTPQGATVAELREKIAQVYLLLGRSSLVLLRLCAPSLVGCRPGGSICLLPATRMLCHSTARSPISASRMVRCSSC